MAEEQFTRDSGAAHDAHPPLTAPSASRLDVLQRIVDGVTGMLGFGMAALNYRRDDGAFEVVAVSGPADAVLSLLGEVLTREDLETELAAADAWGELRFVPHGRLSTEQTSGSWFPDLPPVESPGAWHPDDALFAPVRDAQGEMVGLLSVDLPEDGLLPGPERQRILERYAVMAGQALSESVARDDLAEQVRLGHTVREVVRLAAEQDAVDDILPAIETTLREGLGLSRAWLVTFDEDGQGAGFVHRTGQDTHPRGRSVRDASPNLAFHLWAHDEVVVGQDGHLPGAAALGFVDEDDYQTLVERVDAEQLGDFVVVPTGSGVECLGYLILDRERPRPWRPTELVALREIAHDVGAVLIQARVRLRERRLVDRLTRLDEARTELLATITHELKSPLTAIVGHVEVLTTDLDLPPQGASSLAAIERNADRLSRIVEDLLVLSSLASAETGGEPQEVDLGAVVHEALDVVGILAHQHGVVLEVVEPQQPALTRGSADQLERLCTNLVSNAVKYSPEGGRVQITVARRGNRVALSVGDEGPGIDPADQPRLFDEFFRASGPATQGVPGTGLGLTIVRRIAERHGGTVAVQSVPGRGSTFEVTFPRVT